MQQGLINSCAAAVEEKSNSGGQQLWKKIDR
jgi:hypothetical protein